MSDRAVFVNVEIFDTWRFYGLKKRYEVEIKLCSMLSDVLVVADDNQMARMFQFILWLRTSKADVSLTRCNSRWASGYVDTCKQILMACSYWNSRLSCIHGRRQDFSQIWGVGTENLCINLRSNACYWSPYSVQDRIMFKEIILRLLMLIYVLASSCA
jgi:hypothetical protein